MKSRVCVVVIFLLLAFTMCVRAVPLQMGKDTPPTVERSVGRHLLLEGVPNFGEVTPTLYRGGQPTREGFDRLAKMGINIVVDTGRSKGDRKQIKQVLSLSQRRCLRALPEVNQEQSGQEDLRPLPPRQ